MAKQETSDFLTAFAIGTVLGVGATLLLRSGKETETERILRELKPLRKRASKQIKRARAGVADGAEAAERFGSEILDTGRSVLSQFRDEIADIVTSARDEIVDAARDTVKGARKSARRAQRADIVESARDRLLRARKAARRQMRRR
jgi:gas vesicle protein